MDASTSKSLDNVCSAAAIQLYLLEQVVDGRVSGAQLADLKKLATYMRAQCRQAKRLAAKEAAHSHTARISDTLPSQPQQSDASRNEAVPEVGAGEPVQRFDSLIGKLLSPSKSSRMAPIPEALPLPPADSHTPVSRQEAAHHTKEREKWTGADLSLSLSPIKLAAGNSSLNMTANMAETSAMFDMVSSVNDWSALKAFLGREDDSGDEKAQTPSVPPSASLLDSCEVPRREPPTPDTLPAPRFSDFNDAPSNYSSPMAVTRSQQTPRSRGPLSFKQVESTALNISPAAKGKAQLASPMRDRARSGDNAPPNKLDFRQVRHLRVYLLYSLTLCCDMCVLQSLAMAIKGSK